MSATFFIVCFIVLMAMAIIWFPLIVWVFRRLRIQHAAIYEELGSPTLIWNNSMRNQWLFFKFLFQGHWKSLGDQPLSKAAGFMRVWLVLYMVGFIAFTVVLYHFGIQ